jgi:hypothetical protein
MSITSRRKRPLDHTIPHLRDTRLIIIATEGKETEKQYFEDEAFQHIRVQIRVLPTGVDGRSAPQHVLARLKEFAAEYELQPNDQLWIAIDKDRWEERALADVCNKAARSTLLRAKAAVSTPCFELWLYLHRADWTEGEVHAEALKQRLRELLGSYNHAKLDMSQFRPGIGDAIVRAKSTDSSERCPWPENPGTCVYKLVEAILSLRTARP